MAKPKPLEKMVNINFTISESEKNKWVEFAGNFPLARVIKETMNKAIYQTIDIDKPTLLQKSMSKDIEELKEKLDLLSKEYLENLKKIPGPNEENIEIKGRILNLLSDFGPLSRERLQKYLGINGDLLRSILAEMSRSRSIDFIPEKQLWSVM